MEVILDGCKADWQPYQAMSAPRWSRQATTLLGAIGLLAAAAALVLTTDEAEAQSNSGSNSPPNFSAGFDAIQLDGGGGGGGKRDGGRLKSGSSFGGGGSKNHGVNFGDLRERCLEDEAFRRRNGTACKHLID